MFGFDEGIEGHDFSGVIIDESYMSSVCGSSLASLSSSSERSIVAVSSATFVECSEAGLVDDEHMKRCKLVSFLVEEATVDALLEEELDTSRKVVCDFTDAFLK